MIRLNEENYFKVNEPLHQLPINTLFAQAVINGQVQGIVFVDDILEPSAFYIVHPQGMSLLFGQTEDLLFHQKLRAYLLGSQSRTKQEWLQVYPDSWNDYIRQWTASDLILEDSRVNFTFNRQKFEAATSHSRSYSDQTAIIIPTTKEIFLGLNGRVIPKDYWKDAEQFLAAGAGYSLIENGAAVSTAFSAYSIGNQLEIGIETAEEARGKGYAFQVSRALISYCLENGLEPVWSCRRQNEASYLLAQKLGFIPSLSIPYYRLPSCS